MANRKRMIMKHRKPRKRQAEPNILERLKKLTDSAPTAKLRGGRFGFDKDIRDISFKDK